jgi:protein-L-isoaspartate(D-aspartate) O-methyltransferase
MVSFQLERRGISDPRVLEAMRVVPRHLFAPAEARTDAWEDHPVSIGHRQTMSQPYMVALMTESLALRGSERVLEVGTGSGYQAAVLSLLCAGVWTMERVPELAVRAAQALDTLGFVGVRLRTGDGSAGWPEEAPFDCIIVTAAAPAVPRSLCDQLADNGVLVVPVGPRDQAQELVTVRRVGASLRVEPGIGCRFVPLLGVQGFPETP